MALVYNGTTIKSVVYNGVTLKNIVYNGVTIFSAGGSIIVSGRTINIGMVGPDGKTLYPYASNVDIGTGWSKVSISDKDTDYNSVSYNSSTGIASFTLYSASPNTLVTATISYE